MVEPSIKGTEQKYICTFRDSSASVDKASVESVLCYQIHFNQYLCTALFVTFAARSI